MKLKKILKKILLPFLRIIRDSYNVPSTERFSLKRVTRTFRYRFASIGIPLTKNEKNLKKFKNKHAGERCFIIGNGPSLNKLDLSKIKNEYTFGVNAIYTNYEKMGFYPTYYVVEDIFVAEDRCSEINNYNESIKFFGDYLKYCLSPDEKSINMNVIYNYTDYHNFPRFSKNVARKIYVGGTVTYLCIQLAYYMGFKEVYLIGIDHNYIIPKEAKVEGYDILSVSDDPNHFNKDYFGKGKRWHDPMLDRMEKAYKKARIYFEKNSRTINNATAGGKLEIFDRIDYNELF